jgi:hypothetical protein
MAQKRTNNSTLMELARRMFVEEGMTAKAIAGTIEVTEQTIGKWRKGVGTNAISWDEQRAQFLSAPHNIKKNLAKELTRLVEGGEATLDMGAINSAIKAIQSMSDETSVETVYSVFKEFDSWMSEQDPEMAVAFLEWHKLYLLHKAQNQ